MMMTIIPAAEINDGVRKHLSIREAAEALGKAESTLRRKATALGVARFSGSSVAGGLLIRASPVDIVVPFARRITSGD